MEKVLITGGAGFIGSTLVDRLVRENYDVIIVDNLFSGKEEYLNPNATLYNLDIGDENNVTKFTEIMQGVDTVFHLAAASRVQPSIEDPISFNKINVEGTLKLLFACHKANVKRVCYTRMTLFLGAVLFYSFIFFPFAAIMRILGEKSQYATKNCNSIKQILTVWENL